MFLWKILRWMGCKSYGLDFDSLHEVNPRLIYCSITGYGQTGPYKDRPGYDTVIQAQGGVDEHHGSRWRRWRTV